MSMNLLFERCQNCFPKDKYPYFRYEVKDNGEAFESLTMQCMKCKWQLRQVEEPK